MDESYVNGDRKSARPHNELTVQMKLDLIAHAETNPNMTQKALAKKYGIGKSTVGDILRRQKHRLLEMKMTTELINASVVAAANGASTTANPEFSYEQIRESLISSERLNNNYPDDIKDFYSINNSAEDSLNDLDADQCLATTGDDDGVVDDEDDVRSDVPEYCPPVKTILHEHAEASSTPPPRRNNNNNKYAEPRKRRRFHAEPMLFAGIDLRHILSPTQLNKCYAALRLPRVSSHFQHSFNTTYCDSDEHMEQDVGFQETDDNSSESSEVSTHSEHSEMSLFDAYELTQHLCNCMKKLLPEGVPYINRCKTLIEKSLGLPTTSGHQTKISDFFSPIKPN